MFNRAGAMLAMIAAVTALAACSQPAATDPTGDAGTTGPEGSTRLQVIAGFYPLQYAAQRVAGDLADVQNLARPGVEPHDLELSPRQVASLSQVRLVVYLSGFQPAVDKAVATQAAGRSLDVRTAARLTPAAEDGQPADPHFWLDPTRLADVADAVATQLGRVDPAHAARFTGNAAALRAELDSLDGELRAGLAHCANTALVTSHQAFGYLARRYGLNQLGITGLSPDAEPDARTLGRVADFVRQHRVRTIYYETLVSPDIARTVAETTGARTAVLDPIEGLSDASSAGDYRGLMRANLATLRAGQPCS